MNTAFWKKALHDTWLHPRYISTKYMRAALSGTEPLVHGVFLDVGCGSSPYRALFDRKIDRYIGVDWPPDLGEWRPDIVGDAQRLPFQDRSFDTILATELIEHLRRPDEFLDEMRRLLRDGGVLIVSAPFLEPVHEEPRDFRRYTNYGLGAIMEDHGFKVERIWARGGWWSVVVGSFAAQTLFEWWNPVRGKGRSGLMSACIVPFLACLQWTGWVLDRLVASERYALGYLVAASPAEVAPGTPK